MMVAQREDGGGLDTSGDGVLKLTIRRVATYGTIMKRNQRTVLRRRRHKKYKEQLLTKLI
jgi:hypothetical protein